MSKSALPIALEGRPKDRPRADGQGSGKENAMWPQHQTLCNLSARTEDEIQASALQFVRKLSSFNKHRRPRGGVRPRRH